MPHRVLIVSGDDAGRSATLRVLIDAGYEALGAGTFEDAKRLLASEPPDLLIADERLGAFNGLHLVVRGHATHPHMRAIVTTSAKDSILESDAKQLDAECIVKPADPMGWLVPISQTLELAALAS